MVIIMTCDYLIKISRRASLCILSHVTLEIWLYLSLYKVCTKLMHPGVPLMLIRLRSFGQLAKAKTPKHPSSQNSSTRESFPVLNRAQYNALPSWTYKKHCQRCL
ncbi:hypothetical protein CEXT_213911 [Caerostris extrusa]|uniref:Uncharacterized protein n=1 Tax=Caerostris extrusa TaxID=172846 RepID=A0AAV4MV01_CAEEX|nr:hypothetical protein CEXT_213911 [Caerostris extrusa]